MSGRTDREGREAATRVQLPLLDRLIDDNPDRTIDPPASANETMTALRHAVRRDLEALLNARRPWASLPPGYGALATSPLGYGIPDFASGAFNDPKRREALCAEVESTIRRFEPRFAHVKVTLIGTRDTLEPLLRLRIEALLHADPAPEPVAYDTTVDATTADVTVRARDDV
jgi:type VI secretion system protein ImpF